MKAQRMNSQTTYNIIGVRKLMEQILYENHYLSLKKRGNYIYSHESRSDGKLVAILVCDSSRPDAVLGRYEICPAHDDASPQLCAITGGVEKGRAPTESAITELREEAGYYADESELEPLGYVRPSKSADTVTYLYAFDANGKARHKVTGDGSKYERGAYYKWVRKEQAIWSKDPLMALMIARKEQGTH